ncbi:Cytosolic non-specific dipeptidase, partial [Toxocara canis]
FRAFSNHSGRYWLTDFKHPHYQCGVKAIKRVYGVEPDYTREGGSIPITITFEELTGNNVMLLPMGAGDDMAHSQNEKINVTNYIAGTKMLAAYLLELGTI